MHNEKHGQQEARGTKEDVVAQGLQGRAMLNNVQGVLKSPVVDDNMGSGWWKDMQVVRKQKKEIKKINIGWTGTALLQHCS